MIRPIHNPAAPGYGVFVNGTLRHATFSPSIAQAFARVMQRRHYGALVSVAPIV